MPAQCSCLLIIADSAIEPAGHLHWLIIVDRAMEPTDHLGWLTILDRAMEPTDHFCWLITVDSAMESGDRFEDGTSRHPSGPVAEGLRPPHAANHRMGLQDMVLHLCLPRNDV
jgi:hypothetical protein